ncbi:MAG TPA: transcription termination/antitermination NusG family protein [Steroidobacteraceae bacterium]|nr:transcription termination/antitermination NusG family protein [Steroidobacteraceae bacterium]
MRRWHLAFTKPAAEELAKLHLERQGYRVYLPRANTKSLRGGKWMDRVTALFPRYLFVQLDAALQSFAPLRSTVGVTGIVKFGGDYTVVPDHVIDSLLSTEDPETGMHKLRVPAWFKPGAPVRIATGAFSGLEGIFESMDGEDRVTVLLNLLGRDARVKVASGFVVGVSA